MNALPNWLVPQTQAREPQEPDNRTLEEVTYDIMFERVLVQVADGRPISQIIRDDPRDIAPGRYLKWIHDDPKREQRYYDARRIGAALVEDELLNIADATEDNMEDVQRSTLRINTRKWLLAVWDRKRYGETKQLDINTTHTVDMRQLLEMREERLNSLRLIEGEQVES